MNPGEHRKQQEKNHVDPFVRSKKTRVHIRLRLSSLSSREARMCDQHGTSTALTLPHCKEKVAEISKFKTILTGYSDLDDANYLLLSGGNYREGD